jgi:hypothetical protein
MGRRFATVIGVVAAGVIALGVQTAAAEAKTVKFTSKIKTSPVSTANGYPSPGGTALFAGWLKLKLGGEGALIDRVTIVDQPAPNVFEFKGKGVDYGRSGSLRTRFKGTATLQADGSQQSITTGHFTGGTGRYRGASGRYKLSGTTPSGSSVLTATSKGVISY